MRIYIHTYMRTHDRIICIGRFALKKMGHYDVSKHSKAPNYILFTNLINPRNAAFICLYTRSISMYILPALLFFIPEWSMVIPSVTNCAYEICISRNFPASCLAGGRRRLAAEQVKQMINDSFKDISLRTNSCSSLFPSPPLPPFACSP